MTEVINLTALANDQAVLPDQDNRQYLMVVLKGTYALDPTTGLLSWSDDELPIFTAAQYDEEPDVGLRYESDMALFKPMTDIVVNGDAVAAGDKPVVELDVTLKVNEHQRTLRVFGDRTWEKNISSWQMSDPEPFTRLPLVYERAYGGLAKESEAKDCDRNPVGKAFYAEKEKPEEGDALPNIEDPNNLISEWNDQIEPVGFAFVDAGWEPRSTYAGTYDEDWERFRKPCLPADFDPQYYNASPFVLPHEECPGAKVELENMSDLGVLSFTLPDTQYEVTLTAGGEETTESMVMDTVVIEPNDLRVAISWRVRFEVTRQRREIERVVISESVM